MSELKGLWANVDGGAHADELLIYIEDGTIQQSWVSSQVTYVLQTKVCRDADADGHGDLRWTETGPPDPTSLWGELTERVTRRVPLPDWDLGFERGTGGTVEVVVNVGLWISVANGDDVVARAEPASGVWAETRATLDRIEFDPGTGDALVVCDGAGTPLPADRVNDPAAGPCGHTYRTVDELGDHNATVTAVWTVTNTASTGESERRADIVLSSDVPIHVLEVQTVGQG